MMKKKKITTNVSLEKEEMKKLLINKYIPIILTTEFNSNKYYKYYIDNHALSCGKKFLNFINDKGTKQFLQTKTFIPLHTDQMFIPLEA